MGLSDEAGAAANVALAVKARQSPKPQEAARLDEYIQRTLWGVDHDIPFPVSLQDHASGGIRASLFWVPTPVYALRCQLGLHSIAFPLFLIVFISCFFACHRLQIPAASFFEARYRPETCCPTIDAEILNVRKSMCCLRICWAPALHTTTTAKE